MKVSKVNFWLLRHTLARRYGDAQGIKSQRVLTMVRIETNDGLVGWGDCFGYRARPSDWEDAASILVGQNLSDAPALVDQIGRLDLSLSGGVDIALWDLRGKAAEMSLSDLLGGVYRKAQPAYASLQNVTEANDPVEDALAEARQAIELGFTSLKMKVGWHDVETDIEWVNKVIDDLPAGVPLAIDANRSMDLPTARRLVRGLRAPERISWFEEPLANTHVWAYRELRDSIDIPVAGAESMPMVMIDEVVRTRSMDIINPDLVGHGGMNRLTRFWHVASAYGVRLVPHIFDGQLTRIATLHFLANRSDWPETQSHFIASPLECDISANPLRDEILGGRLKPDANGCIAVPKGPGLGVEINEDLIKHYTIAHY
jgi:D-galactarolactone cycloisomerase